MIRTTLIGLLVLAAGALAQPPGPAGGRGRFGGPPGPGMQGPGMGRVLGAEAGMPGQVVKNAPYTADVVTETSQTLADGSHIHQSSTAHVYRDSDGRTRREQSLRSLNGLAPNANLPQVVFIHDPVAETSYALNPTEKTATKSPWTRHEGGQRGPNSPMARQQGQRPGPGPMGQFRRGSNQNVKTEALGRQAIEGVPADGTRTTMTIPAGQIGNDQPLQVVTETWYSQDLQTVVMQKRTDPRMGDTVTRMNNVSRSEPSRSLFEVPADYKVTETANRMMRGPARQ